MTSVPHDQSNKLSYGISGIRPQLPKQSGLGTSGQNPGSPSVRLGEPEVNVKVWRGLQLWCMSV